MRQTEKDVYLEELFQPREVIELPADPPGIRIPKQRVEPPAPRPTDRPAHRRPAPRPQETWAEAWESAKLWYAAAISGPVLTLVVGLLSQAA